MSNNYTIIHWINFHARTQNLADYLSGEAHFMQWASPGRHKGFKLVKSWIKSSIKTFEIIRKSKPSSVIIAVSPPTFSPLVVLLCCKVLRREFIVDVHSGTYLDPRWRKLMRVMTVVERHAKSMLVTNSLLQHEIRNNNNVFVVHDPFWTQKKTDPGLPAQDKEIYFVYPCSGANDEPIEKVIEAAREIPKGVRIYLTGNLAQFHHGSNITFTGFLPINRYNELILGATGIISLTTREGYAQRSAYEGLAQDKKLVVSSTEAMREIFGSFAHYANPSDSKSIAIAISEAFYSKEPDNQILVSKLMQITETSRRLFDSL